MHELIVGGWALGGLNCPPSRMPKSSNFRLIPGLFFGVLNGGRVNTSDDRVVGKYFFAYTSSFINYLNEPPKLGNFNYYVKFPVSFENT